MSQIRFQDRHIIIVTRQLTPNGVFQEIHARPKPDIVFRDLFAFMDRYAGEFARIMTRTMDGFSGKYQARVHVVFVKFDRGEIVDRTDPWLITDPVEKTDSMEDLMSILCSNVGQAYANVALEKSGWTFESMLQFDINRARFQIAANRGQCHRPPPLPKSILPMAVISVDRSPVPTRNFGPNCFIDAVTIAAYIANHGGAAMPKVKKGHQMGVWRRLVAAGDPLNLVFHTKLESLTGVDTRDIYLFENDNPRYFIAVLTTDGVNGFHCVRQFKVTRYREAEKRGEQPLVLHLLLYEGHFVAIHRLDSLLRLHQYQYFCSFCLQPFRSRDIRDSHMEACDTTFNQQFSMPKEGSTERFLNHALKCQHHPYAIYADIESYHEKEEPLECGEEDSSPPPVKRVKTNTTIEGRHRPYMAAYYLAFSETFIPKLEKIGRLKTLLPEYPHGLYKEFIGEACIEQFIDSIINLTQRLAELFKFHNRYDYDKYISMALMDENCPICACPVQPEEKPVLDHDHWRGDLRGWAHNDCNLAVRQLRRFTPIIMHNFRGYDGHMICKYLKFKDDLDVSLSPIAVTTEKYLSLSIRYVIGQYVTRKGKTQTLYAEIRFLDSLQFLSCSLATLIDQLNSNNDDSLFFHTNRVLGKDPNLLAVSKQKGIFPHEYITSMAVLNETKLPGKNHFGCGLNSSKQISDEEYAFAQRVWQLLNYNTLMDYARQYCRIDVVGLADVFERFRNISLQDYSIDPVLCYSLPNLAWAAMLRKTAIELELVIDYELYCTLERGIRGGLCQLTKHYTQGDNIFINPAAFTSADDPSAYLFLIDANGLYSWAMTQPLPYGGLQFVEDSEKIAQLFPPDNLDAWPGDTEPIGYFLVVDLHYPQHLHDSTASYPLAPDQEVLPIEDYSLTMIQQLIQSNGGSKRIPKERKLMATVRDKKNYVVHYRLLKLYLQQGLRLTHIHAAIEFKQAPFMKEYIDFNIGKRIEHSRDKAASDFYKKLNNAVFGKTQEQQRKHRNFKLASDAVKQMKLIASPTYRGSVIFQENLAGFYMAKARITLKHPIFTGAAILDISKHLMYSFFCTQLKPLFNDVNVIYTDTDSLLIELRGRNIMSTLGDLRDDWLDGSNMPPQHPLHTIKNKGLLGYFKEEMGGEPIEEVVALRPKMYCIKSSSGIKKTAKGINSTVVKEKLMFDDYKQVYIDEAHQPLFTNQRNFTSVRHEIRTIQQRKKALTIADTKRYWSTLNESLPFGHYRIPELQAATYEARRALLKEQFNIDLESAAPLKRQMRPYKYPQEVPAGVEDETYEQEPAQMLNL